MSRSLSHMLKNSFMKTGLNRFLILSSIIGILGPASSVADTVFLNSNESVSGMITFEDDQNLHIMNEDGMRFQLKKTQITEIRREPTAFTFKTQADKDYEDGLYRQAIQKYENAIGLGGDREELTAKIDEVEDAIIDQQLGGLATDLRNARALAEQERFDEAEAMIKSLVQKASQNANGADPEVIRVASEEMGDILIAKARYHVDNINYKDAEVEYKKAIHFDPQNHAIHTELGDLYARKSITHPQAVKNYLRAIEVGQDSLDEEYLNDLHYKTAELYFDNQMWESAARHYRTVYKSNPIYSLNLSRKLIDSLTFLAEKGELDNRGYAISALSEAAEIAPENAEIRELLGDLLTIEEDYDEAVFYYKSALNIQSNRVDTNQKIAYIYRATRNPEEEEKHLSREVVIDPEDYDSLCNLGDVQWKLGEWDEAIENYTTAQEIDPDNPRALVALASSERRLGNYSEARRAIQKILDKYPDDVRAQLEMGLVFLDEKKYEASEPYFTEVLELIEEEPLESDLEQREILAQAYTARGTVNLNVSGPSTAINDFEKALAEIEDYPEAFFKIGEAFQKKYSSSSALADLLKAEENMLRARFIDENNAEFALGLGVFYHKTLAQEDRPNEAIYQARALEQYNEYIEMGGTQIEQVRGFIRELEVGAPATPVAEDDATETESEESTETAEESAEESGDDAVEENSEEAAEEVSDDTAGEDTPT